jgi:hypothetical protein
MFSLAGLLPSSKPRRVQRFPRSNKQSNLKKQKKVNHSFKGDLTCQKQVTACEWLWFGFEMQDNHDK